jgi:hypothetical protein
MFIHACFCNISILYIETKSALIILFRGLLDERLSEVDNVAPGRQPAVWLPIGQDIATLRPHIEPEAFEITFEALRTEN